MSKVNQQASNTLIASLQDRSIYPHEVKALSLLETHISWVILTGTYAYKIKKPVNFGFLDFSTLAKRKFFCEQELRLNQRFSDKLYVDVVKITGSVDHPHINGSGTTLDYAVRMVEFSQQSLLINQVQQFGLTGAQIDSLAQQLARFHDKACRPDASHSGTPVYGSLEAVWSPVIENFEHIQPLLTQADDKQQLQRLLAWSRSEFKRLGEFIEQRRANGFVRECHGDLHLGNIAIIDQEITLFDCIEFSDQLRWIDTCCELAYVIMDLESNHHVQWANRLLNHYLEYSGDFSGLTVLKFYKVYRALVRAKVTILRLQQSDLSAQERDSLYQTYLHYVNLADGYAMNERPFLLITHGVAGSGKSTVSECIATLCQAIRLRSDIERKRLFGLQPHDSSHSSLQAGIYSAQATEKTFNHLRLLAGELLQANYPVIVDAAFLAREQRDAFSRLATQLDVAFIILDCQLDQQTLQERLVKRSQQTNEASEAGVDVMKAQWLTRDALTADELAHTFVVDTGQTLDIDQLLDVITRSNGAR